MRSLGYSSAVAIIDGMDGVSPSVYARPRRRAFLAVSACAACVFIATACGHRGPDLNAARDRVTHQLQFGQIDQLIAEGDPQLQAEEALLRRRLASIPTLVRMHNKMRTSYQYDFDSDGLGHVGGTMTLDNLTMWYEMVFRADEAGVPHLAQLELVPLRWTSRASTP